MATTGAPGIVGDTPNFPGNNPDLASLINTMIGHATTNDSMDEMVHMLGQHIMDLNNQAGAARTALTNAQAAPMPTTNPLIDSITKSMGSLADKFSGGVGGAAGAHDLIAGEQANMLQQRAERLAMMEKDYSDLASRARDFGDKATALQYEEKAHRAQEQRDQAFTIMRDQLRAKGDLEGSLKVENVRQTGENDRQAKLLDERLKEAGIDSETRKKVAEITAGSRENVAGIHYGGRSNSSTFLKDEASYGTAVRLALNSVRDNKSRRIKNKKGAVTSFLNVAPTKEYVGKPDEWLLRIMNEPDPDKPDQYLIPRDVVLSEKNGGPVPAKAYDQIIQAYMRRHFPDWAPTQVK